MLLCSDTIGLGEGVITGAVSTNNACGSSSLAREGIYGKLLFYSVISNHLSSYFTWLNEEDPHCYRFKELLNLFTVFGLFVEYGTMPTQRVPVLTRL